MTVDRSVGRLRSSVTALAAASPTAWVIVQLDFTESNFAKLKFLGGD
jgi:hypothetical protein